MPVERINDLPPLPSRAPTGHKGSFGRALIIAGSRGMSGAACLSGLGALRGGAGLVFLAVPENILPIVAAVEPSYLTIPLPDDNDGRIAESARERIFEEIQKCDVIAIGPGCGQSSALSEIVAELYASCPKPLVVDADGLNALAGLEQLPTAAGPRVLTPHPGEFARLTHSSIGEIQGARESTAQHFAEENGCVLLLKGPDTVITDGRRLAINTTGNSGMGTGGTGDVLTGILTALLAQQMEPFAAAQLAAHLHGLAGDLAAAELSEPGLIASDLPRYLPLAWRKVSLEQGV